SEDGCVHAGLPLRSPPPLRDGLTDEIVEHPSEQLVLRCRIAEDCAGGDVGTIGDLQGGHLGESRKSSSAAAKIASRLMRIFRSRRPSGRVVFLPSLMPIE